ncbi:uncharacterized protein [Salminus brasiliensis]|uniref:uncharacterized protein n=1 Tax=Salminus brasiliensis TaxID=930266 RepID=UPI003B83672B
METQRKYQTAEVWLCQLQIQSAFRTWRWAAKSHKTVRCFTQRVKKADRKRLLSAALQAWHKETQARKQRDLHLSEKYFTLWALEVQRKQSERQLRARRRAKWMRLWRYRVVERREQRELTRLYWDSWKSQTAASLLFTQQHWHEALQKAWLTWRKRHIRNRVIATYTASLNRALLLKALRLWWRRALALGFLPSRAPARSYSL